MSLQAISNAIASHNPFQNKPQKNGEEFDTEKLLNGDNSIKSSATKSQAANVQKQDNNFFGQLLESVKGSGAPVVNAETMQARLSSILEKGTSIQHHPLPGEVKAYIKDVRDFLADVNKHAYEGQRNENGLFEKINVVNRKLDTMAEELVAGQQNEIALVNSLGQLQGLLIDLYV